MWRLRAAFSAPTRELAGPLWLIARVDSDALRRVQVAVLAAAAGLVQTRQIRRWARFTARRLQLTAPAATPSPGTRRRAGRRHAMVRAVTRDIRYRTRSARPAWPASSSPAATSASTRATASPALAPLRRCRSAGTDCPPLTPRHLLRAWRRRCTRPTTTPMFVPAEDGGYVPRRDLREPAAACSAACGVEHRDR